MPEIKSVTDLQNTNECALETSETDAAISETETKYITNRRLYDARSAFLFLKEKCFNRINYI